MAEPEAEALANPDAEAAADAWHGYYGYGRRWGGYYGGYYGHSYGYGYYRGKRSADTEPEASAVAEPEANADAEAADAAARVRDRRGSEKAGCYRDRVCRLLPKSRGSKAAPDLSPQRAPANGTKKSRG